jgi:hypothetical protein
MTLDGLIAALEELRADVGGDADVRFAAQPRWAFEYAIASEVVGVVGAGDGGAVVYLAEGQQLGYLPGPAAVAIGWSSRDAGDDEDADPVGVFVAEAR